MVFRLKIKFLKVLIFFVTVFFVLQSFPSFWLYGSETFLYKAFPGTPVVVDRHNECRVVTNHGNLSALGGSIQATGGDRVYTYVDSGISYKVHEFTTAGSSNFVVTNPGSSGSIEYLIVAGGGGGGSGGGGGGGFLTGTLNIGQGTHNIVVGTGGFGHATLSQTVPRGWREFRGGNGGNSSALGFTAVGGGGGGAYGDEGAAVRTGAAGGSGGGGGGLFTNQTNSVGGAGQSGQGNNGGNSSPTVNDRGGGGGGAAAAGNAGNAGTNPGKGGDGLASTITGISVVYGGGGGGGEIVASGSASLGGLGGGGAGGFDSTLAVAGINGLGGGGGGGSYVSGQTGLASAAGGSGIVIIRYPYSGLVGHWTFDECGNPSQNVVPDGNFSTQTLQSPYLSAGGGGSLSFITDYAPTGGNILKHVNPTAGESVTAPHGGASSKLANASAGEVWTASVWVKSTTASTSVELFLFALDTNNNAISGGFALVGSRNVGTDWERLVVTHTLPAGTHGVSMRLDNNQEGKEVHWNGWQLEKKGSVSDYCNVANVAPNYVTDSLRLYLDASNPASYSGSGTVWNDLSGNGFHATLHNSPTFVSSGGYFSFNGSNQTASIANAQPNIVGQISTEIWVYFNDVSNQPCLLTKGYHYLTVVRAANTYSWSDSSIWDTATYGTRTATGIGTTGVWKQIVTTKDSSNTVRIYVDGTLLDTRTAFGSPLTSQTGSTLFITGYSNDHTFPASLFLNGRIAIARVYNKALSLAEIQQNFDAHKGSVGSSSAPASTVKCSGCDYDGVNYNNTRWYQDSTNRLGGAYEFNGTNNYIKVPSLEPFNLQKLSIASWVNFTDDSQSHIFEKGNVNTQYSLYSGGTNIIFRTKPVGEAVDTLSATKAAAGITNGQWHHIVATYNGSVKKIYVDGVERATKNWSKTLEYNNNDVSIGRFGGTSSGYFFTGSLGDVRVYNNALSAGEVLNLYKLSPLLVPTKIAAEWTAFRDNAPHTDLVNCMKAPQCYVSTGNCDSGYTSILGGTQSGCASLGPVTFPEGSQYMFSINSTGSNASCGACVGAGVTHTRVASFSINSGATWENEGSAVNCQTATSGAGCYWIDGRCNPIACGCGGNCAQGSCGGCACPSSQGWGACLYIRNCSDLSTTIRWCCRN